MKTIIIVTTLNELEGVKKVLPNIWKGWYDKLIVLDGRSSDGTRKWCSDQGYEVYCQQGCGLWNAYTELQQLLGNEDAIVITMSPDGNCPPYVIPRLLSKMEEGYDMVVASRYLDGGISDDDTRLTAFGNHILTWIVNLRGTFHYTDALNMYRAYKLSLVNQLGLNAKPNWLQRKLARLCNLYSWEPSLSIRASKARLLIAEVPALEPKAFRERRQNTCVHGLTILLQIVHEKWLRSG